MREQAPPHSSSNYQSFVIDGTTPSRRPLLRDSKPGRSLYRSATGPWEYPTRSVFRCAERNRQRTKRTPKSSPFHLTVNKVTSPSTSKSKGIPQTPKCSSCNNPHLTSSAKQGFSNELEERYDSMGAQRRIGPFWNGAPAFRCRRGFRKTAPFVLFQIQNTNLVVGMLYFPETESRLPRVWNPFPRGRQIREPKLQGGTRSLLLGLR